MIGTLNIDHWGSTTILAPRPNHTPSNTEEPLQNHTVNTQPNLRAKTKKVILMWTHTKRRDISSHVMCKHIKAGSCVLTEDRSQSQVADGVIFQLWYKSWTGTVPKQRFPWQSYVLRARESPSRTFFRWVSQCGFVRGRVVWVVCVSVWCGE